MREDSCHELGREGLSSVSCGKQTTRKIKTYMSLRFTAAEVEWTVFVVEQGYFKGGRE